ncbi:hypothetical protein D7V91_11710 [bacterium 1xD42-67]|nr:hypothetical protein D7V91_11710 [bacterium 1xD42-67]
MKFVLIEVIEREISTPAFFGTYQEAYDEMVSRVREAFDEEDITFGEPDDCPENGEAAVMETTAYGERHGNNYDWKIFEI